MAKIITQHRRVAKNLEDFREGFLEPAAGVGAGRGDREEEEMGLEHGEVTGEIIGAAFEVHGVLGYGFLEKVYVGAMKVEFDKVGLSCVREMPIRVNYEGVVVGEYSADFLVEEKVLVEVKAIDSLREKDERQLKNYLKGTRIEVGLLVNFGDEPKFRRQFYSNENKKGLV